MMLSVPSRPSSAPPDPAEQEQWIIVQHSKPKSPNNQQHTHAYPHGKSKQHGLLPPHPHHQSRRKSQSEVDSSISASSVASSASSSRRSSLSQIQSAEFASFRRGSGSGSGSRANQDGDWRRTTVTAPNENVGVTVPAGTVIATTPTNMSDNAKKKDTPKSKKTPKTSHRNLPPRSNTPVQPHAVIHQLGHSRFSLGPTDFPDLTFRRIIWQQERSAAANSAETPLTNATTAIAVPIADDVALIGDRASDSVTVQLPSEIESDDILIQSDSSNDIVEVVHNPKQAMVEVESTNDATTDVAPPAEVIVAAESTIAVPLSPELPANENENAAADDEDDKITALPIDSIESPSLTSPSSKSKKKKKKKNSSNQSANVPTEPVEPVEPSTPIEAVDSDEAIKPVDEDTIDATSSAPSVTMSDDTEMSDQFSNYRSLLLPIAYSLVALLILLASFFPISRVLTIPTALLLLAGIITLHHPMIESKLPPALQFRSLFPSAASDQFSKDNLALLSHTNQKKTKQTKKKGKGGRR